MKPVPILFLSDSPQLPTGLARITKDLATQTASMPQFRVGVMGRAGWGSSQLPFAQFNFPETAQWGEEYLRNVWEDFAKGEKGVVFTIWDLSRLDWLARPRGDDYLSMWLREKPFQLWGYIPVDSYGVGGRITGQLRDTLKGFDRVLAYSMFGQQVLQPEVGEVPWAPHGYNGKVFKVMERRASRAVMQSCAHEARVLFGPDDLVVGCVMTNQLRKDWGTAFAAIARLKNQKPNVRLWAHTDSVDRHWNLMALADDFGLMGSVLVTITGTMTSENLALMYNACDVTMLPSLGEGFGYPIIESMACGVPCVHTNYGGGAELIPDKSWLVDPVATRLDTRWNVVRPVLEPDSWANTLSAVLDEGAEGGLQRVSVEGVAHLSWDVLWPSVWSKWLLGGLQQ